MTTFSVKQKYEEAVKQIWDNDKYNNIPIKQHGYALQETIEKGALLFVGLNPSNPNKDNWCGFYNNTQERTDDTHKYFSKFIDISKEVGLSWSHIDLLFVRWTNQKEVEQIMSEENGVEFLWEQLMISKQIIEEAKPEIIVVNNSLARRLLGFEKKGVETGKPFDVWMGFDFEFDNNIGTHRITNNEILSGTPVFFTSMLTGQRALDNGSYQRLIWHINYVKKFGMNGNNLYL